MAVAQHRTGRTDRLGAARPKGATGDIGAIER
jgi:hypothetical protein